MLDLSQNYFKEVFMSEDNNIETNIEKTVNEAPDTESKMSRADHHKHLDEKYPTKRGFWDIVAKDGFLLLTHILCDMKCIGRENFPKDNPYVVASNHQSYPDGVLIIDYLPTFKISLADNTIPTTEITSRINHTSILYSSPAWGVGGASGVDSSGVDSEIGSFSNSLSMTSPSSMIAKGYTLLVA